MNFLKAKDSYKFAAKVQDMMGKSLCELLKIHRLKEFDRVFEFGCGTGEFSQKLQKNIIFKDYVRNDILDYKSEFEVEIFDMNCIPKAFLKVKNLILSPQMPLCNGLKMIFLQIYTPCLKKTAFFCFQVLEKKI